MKERFKTIIRKICPILACCMLIISLVGVTFVSADSTVVYDYFTYPYDTEYSRYYGQQPPIELYFLKESSLYYTDTYLETQSGFYFPYGVRYDDNATNALSQYFVDGYSDNPNDLIPLICQTYYSQDEIQIALAIADYYRYYDDLISISFSNFYVDLSSSPFLDFAIYDGASGLYNPDFTVFFTYSLLGEDIIHEVTAEVSNTSYNQDFKFTDIAELLGYDTIYIYDLEVSTEFSGEIVGFEFVFDNTWVLDYTTTDYRLDDLLSYNLIHGGKYPDALYNATAFLTSSVAGFMQADLFGFGVTFGGILLVIITFSLVMWFLKVFAGG